MAYSGRTGHSQRMDPIVPASPARKRNALPLGFLLAVVEAPDFSRWWRNMDDPWMNHQTERLLQVMAETEEIGVAVANLYPDLTLSGNIGFENDELRNFFDSTNLAWAILGDVMVRKTSTISAWPCLTAIGPPSRPWPMSVNSAATPRSNGWTASASPT